MLVRRASGEIEMTARDAKRGNNECATSPADLRRYGRRHNLMVPYFLSDGAACYLLVTT